MKTDNNSSPVVVEPKLIIRYLISNGWKSDTPKRSLHRVWLPEDTDGAPVEVFFSGVEGQERREANFALQTLSQVYEKSIDQIANEIRRLNFDLICSRIPDEYVRNESIELKVATQFLDKMKVLLAASATTEITGARFYKRVLKDGAEYSERCRFGHTFRGSFGFQIESPVGFNDQPTFTGVDQEAPFERKVVLRITNGLSSLVRAINEDDPEIIVAQPGGFSSNMCDAIADIIDEIEISKLDIAISLSPEWSSKKEYRFDYSIHQRDVEILRAAAKSMRVDDPVRKVRVYGRIKRLQTDGNPADLVEDKSRREIELGWLNEDNQLLSVKIGLDPKDYLIAVEAHKNGDVVHASGELVRLGRSWHLIDARNFSVMRF